MATPEPNPPTEPMPEGEIRPYYPQPTARQMRRAEREARPRLPHRTQLWMRFYMMAGTIMFLLGLFVDFSFMVVAICLALIMAVHGLAVTVAMTYRRNNP